MYFLPRNNSLYSLLINLNPIVRYLLILFLISGIFFLWFFTFHANFNNKQINLVAEIETLKSKEKLLEDIKKEINSIFLEVQDINNQIDLIASSCSGELENDGFDLLVKNAKSLNLIITSFNFDNYSVKESHVKNVIKFNFKGQFDQVIEFFKSLSFSKQWLKFKKINISTDADNQIKVESVCKFYTPKKGFKWQSKEISINA